MTGHYLILSERKRQIEKEGYSTEHDDLHTHNELTDAGDAYLKFWNKGPSTSPPKFWPWEKESWKPSANPITNVVKAAALYMAEIDRIKRSMFDDKPAIEWLNNQIILMENGIDELLIKQTNISSITPIESQEEGSDYDL